MSENITCNLVENALDYLLLAGELANQDSPRMLKHAVATLADGIELLLKARLEVYDWSLIFKDVDDAERTKLQSGDFQSVTFDQAVKRLKGICGVELDPKQLVILNGLRRLRNRIRHFAVTVDKAEAVSLMVKTYSFGIDFTTEQLEEHLGAEANQSLDLLRRTLGEFEAFVNTRLKEVEPILAGQSYANHVDCPQCYQQTLYPDGGTASCAFCGYKASGESAAAEWAIRTWGGSPKDRMIDPVVESCPECGANACVRLEDGDGFQCLSCGESGDYDHCSQCGQLFSGEEEGGRCSNCWQDLINKEE